MFRRWVQVAGRWYGKSIKTSNSRLAYVSAVGLAGWDLLAPSHITVGYSERYGPVLQSLLLLLPNFSLLCTSSTCLFAVRLSLSSVSLIFQVNDTVRERLKTEILGVRLTVGKTITKRVASEFGQL